MALVSIGEFARLSRLSPKALRLYDELELLPPSRVDPDSGYRWYDTDELDRARLVASLRQIGVPLAQIKVVLDLSPVDAADQVAAYWDGVETDHRARRQLATYLVQRLNGTRLTMYEVATRQMPARTVLCLKRHVNDNAEVETVGKGFIGIFKGRPAPRIGSIVGAAFLIYYGEVTDDSDGPIEWCRPIPDDDAAALAAGYPELTMRVEPAHREAYVNLGTEPVHGSQWPVISETLHGWAAEHHERPSNLGVRVTFLASLPLTPTSRPDCDFAVPLLD